MTPPNGLGDRARLTQSGYRTAVSETIRGLQNGASDTDMADAWGVSSSTVENARNMKHDLSGVSLLKIGKEFGPDALNTVAALIDAKMVPLRSITLTPDDIAAIPCNVAAALPTMIRLLADGDCSDADVRQLDREGVVDCFVKLADMLQQRRDDLRLKVVA
jgi:hypothetical protein